MALAKYLFDGAVSATVDYELIPTDFLRNIGTLGMTEEAIVAASLRANVYVSRLSR